MSASAGAGLFAAGGLWEALHTVAELVVYLASAAAAEIIGAAIPVYNKQA